MLISLEYKSIEDGKEVDKVLEFSSSLLAEPYKKESLFVVIVEGKSMQPVILDNALVIADLSQKELKDGLIYLVYYEEKMWIKQLSIKGDDACFVSINPDYSHLVYPKEECHLVARVLLTFTKL